MNVSRLFILRPVATTLLMFAVLLAGWLGYRSLPISSLPEVDYPTIQITTLYPGASSDVIASSITSPLEKQLGQIAGLNQMSSESGAGVSSITLQFDLRIKIDVAEQEVQAALNAANNLLPTDLPNPPIYNKVNPADTPILALAITSEKIPLPQVQAMIETRLAQKLSQVSGVGLVSLAGGQRPAVRVQVNPTALAAHGLTLEDVRTSIGNANVNLAKGSIDGGSRSASIDANDQLKSAAEYAQVVLAYRNGAPIRLQDVASLIDGTENIRLAAWAHQKPAIILNVQRQPGANVIETVDRIKALLPGIQEGLPASIKVEVLNDRTISIRAAIKDVQFELILAIVLVVLVIFVFLRNLPATVIPSIAVPISLIGTFGVMSLLGFSLNNLTLMALVIAAGFVVDDAIVTIENIARHIENGEKPLPAALKGAKEIGFTILSLTISLVAVLIPLLFMSDVIGRLFREFAITLALAILISAVVSLTLTPMLCAAFLKHHHGEEKGLSGLIARFFERMVAFYALLLRWVLRHQFLTMLVAFATLGLTIAMYMMIPKSFFPVQDTGIIQGITQTAGNASFEAMRQGHQSLIDEVVKDPAVDHVATYIGADGVNLRPNYGRMMIYLKPHEHRTESIQIVMQRLQKKVEQQKNNIQLYMQAAQELTVDTQLGRTQYQFTLQDNQFKNLEIWTPKLLAELEKLPQLSEVTSDLEKDAKQLYINIDRTQAARLGVTVAGINNILYNAFGQRMISTIFTQSSQYRVVLEVAKQFQDEPKKLNQLFVPSSTGTPVQLSSVATWELRPAYSSIQRIGQFPATSISFNVAKGYALSDAVAAIEKIQQQLLPKTVELHWQGTAAAFGAANSNQVWLIIAAIVCVYIVLGVLYESYIHPITILSTLPSAGVGALLALMLARMPLDMVGIIGIILLIGIVKKNAIMMIDFALDAERTEKKTPHEAIYQAALLRFRPILMTTMAALLGALPLMLSQGVGAELRIPLGLAMVGGLAVSQVLTLFTTPVIYLFFDRLARSVNKMRGKSQEALS